MAGYCSLFYSYFNQVFHLQQISPCPKIILPQTQATKGPGTCTLMFSLEI